MTRYRVNQGNQAGTAGPAEHASQRSEDDETPRCAKEEAEKFHRNFRGGNLAVDGGVVDTF